MENENKKMTLAEIDAELATLPEAINAATQELREIEATNDQSAKGLDKHAKASSKLTLLKTRKAALDAARPMAELESKKQAVEEARLACAEAGHSYKEIKEEVRQVLLPILGPRGLDEIVDGALKVQPLLFAERKAHGKYRILLEVAIKWAGEHGLKYQPWQK